MNSKDVFNLIQSKQSLLCVGLDIDTDKMPAHLSRDFAGIKEFLMQIVDATREHCIAYKPNLAFFEVLGSRGLDVLGEINDYIGSGHFKIADAKRGDIGNTASAYAKTFFETFSFDAITVNPYMGYDTIEPYLVYTNKTTIVLGITSNPGFAHFQDQVLSSGEHLYAKVIREMADQFSSDQLMFVVGATRGQYIENARKAAPDHFFLMPGIGAQGGDLQEAVTLGLNEQFGLIINSSRGILYADKSEEFASAAGLASKQLQEQIFDAVKQAGKNFGDD